MSEILVLVFATKKPLHSQSQQRASVLGSTAELELWNNKQCAAWAVQNWWWTLIKKQNSRKTQTFFKLMMNICKANLKNSKNPKELETITKETSIHRWPNRKILILLQNKSDIFPPWGVISGWWQCDNVWCNLHTLGHCHGGYSGDTGPPRQPRMPNYTFLNIHGPGPEQDGVHLSFSYILHPPPASSVSVTPTTMILTQTWCIIHSKCVTASSVLSWLKGE